MPVTAKMREPGTECPRCRAPGFVCYKDLDGPHGLGLRAPVALSDLELHPLALFEGAVAIRLDGGEVDEDVPTTVDRDEAVALVRVEPFDGALSHTNNSLTLLGLRAPLLFAEPG